MQVKLTTEQNQATDEIFEFLYSFDQKVKPYWVLSGNAGCGKTTVISHIIKTFNEEKILRDDDKEKDIAVATLTWKAANVLKKKGVKQAQSIHSLIYEIIEKNQRSGIAGLEFRRKPKNELQKKYKLIIIDESSMIDFNILEDLLHYELPILLVGDNFQLPPIRKKEDKEKYGPHFLESPDSKLTQIHRTALDNPIIEISHRLRNGDKYIGYGNYKDLNRVFVVKKTDVKDNWLLVADQILVGYNTTRKEINNRIRACKGITIDSYPNQGEKIIALNNIHSKGLFNGMQFLCDSDLSDTKFTPNKTISIKLKEEIILEDKESFKNHTIAAAFPDMEKEYVRKRGFNEILEVALGYAITVHKSQGSEWDKVIFYNQAFGDNELDRLRFSYTGITRSRDKIIIVY